MSDKNTGLTIDQLFVALGLDGKRIEAVLIKPVRNGDMYLKGTVIGFKSGVWGGGYSKYVRDKDADERKFPSMPTSYRSDRRHWIKKPKVHVEYDVFTYGKGGLHSDWVVIDNCTFNIIIEEKTV